MRECVCLSMCPCLYAVISVWMWVSEYVCVDLRARMFWYFCTIYVRARPSMSISKKHFQSSVCIRVRACMFVGVCICVCWARLCFPGQRFIYFIFFYFILTTPGRSIRFVWYPLLGQRSSVYKSIHLFRLCVDLFPSWSTNTEVRNDSVESEKNVV